MACYEKKPSSGSQKLHILLAAPEVPDVEVVFVEQLKPQIAEWCALPDLVMLPMRVTTAGDDHRQSVTGVV